MHSYRTVAIAFAKNNTPKYVYSWMPLLSMHLLNAKPDYLSVCLPVCLYVCLCHPVNWAMNAKASIIIRLLLSAQLDQKIESIAFNQSDLTHSSSHFRSNSFLSFVCCPFVLFFIFLLILLLHLLLLLVLVLLAVEGALICLFQGGVVIMMVGLIPM